MIRSTRTVAILAFSALSGFALINCGGDKKPADSPETMPSAEPPSEVTPAEADAGTTMNTKSVDTAQAKADAAPAKAEPAKADPLSDEQIAAITDAANTAEIEQAKLAESKSKDPGVKRFAAMMIMHHGAAKQKQAKLKLKPQESATSTALQTDAASTLEMLKSDKGKDFDKAYIAAQIDGHQKVLDTINDKLLPNVKSPDLKAYLDEIKPRVEQHLKEAKQLQESFDSKSSSVSMTTKHAG
jgi:putative membrane protein